jgi:geranylgeranyl pyrophosphate synthase
MSFDQYFLGHAADLEALLARWNAAPHALGRPQRYAYPQGSDPGGRALLAKMVQQQLSSGGKRLRGLLPVALVSAAGGDVQAALALGAAVELVHNGTLAHDDVQDGDRLRRGVPTLWTSVGEAQAINAGDAMLTAPLGQLLSCDQIAQELRAPLALLLADAIAETIRGQVADLGLRDLAAPTLDELMAVHLAKTGPLFGTCLAGAALILGQSAAAVEACHEAARHLGLAFQLRDDLLDVLGTKGRGAAGADLQEGKWTAPMLLAAPQDRPGAAEMAADLRRAADGQALEADRVAHWVHWARRLGGVEATEAILDQELAAFSLAAEKALPAACQPVLHALVARLMRADG